MLCHADLHAGNLLVEDNGTLHIIDWDEILLAPRERDLMYIGGGLLGNWRAPEDEEILFYQGYGPVTIDPVAMAYYRYERIITDLAIYAGELLALGGSQEEAGAVLPLHGLQLLSKRRAGDCAESGSVKGIGWLHNSATQFCRI